MSIIPKLRKDTADLDLRVFRTIKGNLVYCFDKTMQARIRGLLDSAEKEFLKEEKKQGFQGLEWTLYLIIMAIIFILLLQISFAYTTIDYKFYDREVSNPLY